MVAHADYAAVRSPKSRAGRIAAASFFDEWEHRKSPVAKEALDRIAAIYVIEDKAAFAPPPSGWHTARRPPRCSMRSSPGPRRPWQSCRQSRRWPRRSATPSSGAKRSPASSPTVGSKSTTTSPRTPCASSLWAEELSLRRFDTGGDRAAAIYTIVQTAKLNGVNPEAYLKDTLTKIADGHPINKIDQLMPWQMSSPAADQPA